MSYQPEVYGFMQQSSYSNSQPQGQLSLSLSEGKQPDNPTWALVLDSIVDEYNWDGEDGPSVWDPKLDPSRGPNPLMNLHNQSTPALNHGIKSSNENARLYDDASLHMSGLRISDPPSTRAPSALGYHSGLTDLPDRSESVMSNHTTLFYSQSRPRHATTLPFDHAQPHQGKHQEQQPYSYPYQHNNTSNTYYDTYYPAGPDSLGVAPAVVPLHTQQSSYYSAAGHSETHVFPSDPSLARLPSVSPSISSTSSLPNPNPADPRSGLQRSSTVTSVDFGSRKKSKAVDLTAPPYTKAYVDDYRQRIKNDPDPEAHFSYAKYLIEAAKKIGADSPDQRAVKKYRDTLIAESLKVVRRLATQGNAYAEAQFFLANCHGTGALGLQVDHERAYHLYLQAAKQNHAAASYRVAVCNEIGAGTRREHPRAFAFYRKAASLGDTAAMYKLGMILLNGSLGQQRNPREAIGWLKRAAEQADEENPHALHELGLLHERKDNSIVVHDEMYAKELFTRAAQFGYIPSQYKLGQCYEYGALGCSADSRRSIAWYTKAAEKGDPEAELALSGWYLTGSEGVLKQSDSEAYLWARRAANKGLSKAEYAVGYYAEVGIGVKQDMELAKRWYMRAAAQGNKRAMNRLTELKRLGNKKSNQGRPTRAQTRDECIVM